MCSHLRKKERAWGYTQGRTNRGHMITMHRWLFFLAFETNEQAGRYVSTQVPDNFIAFQTHPCDVSQESSFLCVFLPRRTTGFSSNYFLFKSKVFSFLRSLLYSTLFPRYHKYRKRNRLLLRKIYNNEESTLPGFSVAFGSTGCSGSAGGRAPFAPLARTLSDTTNSWGGGGIRGHAPPGNL